MKFIYSGIFLFSSYFLSAQNNMSKAFEVQIGAGVLAQKEVLGFSLSFAPQWYYAPNLRIGGQYTYAHSYLYYEPLDKNNDWKSDYRLSPMHVIQLTSDYYLSNLSQRIFVGLGFGWLHVDAQTLSNNAFEIDNQVFQLIEKIEPLNAIALTPRLGLNWHKIEVLLSYTFALEQQEHVVLGYQNRQFVNKAYNPNGKDRNFLNASFSYQF